MQVITSTGFGDSGSSAITDLLSEYEGIKSFGSEWECTFLHAPDGLSDLESAVLEGHRLKVDFAVTRFLNLSKRLGLQKDYKNAFHGNFYKLSEKFINSFFDITWNGMYEDKLPIFVSGLTKKDKSLIDYANTFYNLEKSKKFEMYESDGWRPSYVPFSNMYYYTDITRFYDCAKKYVESLINEVLCDNESIRRLYLDQLLPPISISKYLQYMPCETKVFVVDKDPRDLFIVENLYNGSRYVPYENVDEFIKWYKSTRNKSRQNIKSENVFHIFLDELIDDYENSCKRVENFLGLNTEEHSAKLTKFDPEKSRVNTKLYKKYSNYSKEISKIENELEDFLCNNFVNKKNEEIENIRIFEKPIINVIEQCNNIQKGNIHKKNKIIIANTTLIRSLVNYSGRKSMIKKIKGIIKILIGMVVFLPQLIVNIIKIQIYSE